jgi:linoleoyl-CoA desaturase
MNYQSVYFGNNKRDFYITLKKRVDQYFKSNNISRHANFGMVFKTVCLFALYLIPYFLIVTSVVNSGLVGWLMGFLMGLGMAGLGFSVMHDAVHESYSRFTFVNKMLGYTLNFLGGSKFNWKIQHNVLHHSFTNIDGHDEDIAPPSMLRFSPHTKLKSIHKLQFIYAYVLYGLMTFMWILVKDFVQMRRYYKKGLIGPNINLKREIIILIISKILYYIMMLVIPMLVTNYAWWQILIGFSTLHFTCGLVLATVFQLAHVMEDMEYPLPNDQNRMEDAWAAHQLKTTANFSPKNPITNWFVGGLNFQVEHHLFPNICHIHYKKISPIVKETAKEFDLPYHTYPNMIVALISHTKMLYQLGRQAA